MPAPDTVLDARFTDPDTSPTSWQTTLQAIEDAQLFWIATTRTDGRPHVTPLVAVWVDDALHFSTGAGEQKGVNLHANPHVVLTTGTNAWDAGLDVVVEGTARRVTERQLLERLAAAWTQKWDGRWQFDVVDDAFGIDTGTSNVFAVATERVLAFGKNPFTHTSYRFPPTA